MFEQKCRNVAWMTAGFDLSIASLLHALFMCYFVARLWPVILFSFSPEAKSIFYELMSRKTSFYYYYICQGQIKISFSDFFNLYPTVCVWRVEGRQQVNLYHLSPI